MKVVIAGYDKMLASLVNAVLDNGHELVGVIRIDRVRFKPITLFFKDILPGVFITY